MNIHKQFTDGPLHVIGADMDEETFTSDVFGHFNVTAARKWAISNLEVTVLSMNTKETLGGKWTDELNPHHLERIAEEEDFVTKLRPLVAKLDDGRSILLDNNHRVHLVAEAAYFAGMESFEVPGYVIPMSVLEKRFRVRIEWCGEEIDGATLLKKSHGLHTSPTGEFEES